MSDLADVPRLKRRSHTWAERSLFFQAVASLIIFRLALRTTSFWTLLRWLRMQEVTADAARSPRDEQRAELIGWAVRAAAARLPWESTCLTQALAAAALLRRNGFPGTLSLGVGQRESPDKGILAHAWLRSGELVLTGEREREQFSELMSFALPGGTIDEPR